MMRTTIAALAATALASSAQAGIYKCTINGAVDGLDGKLKPTIERVVKTYNPLIINTATGFVRFGKGRLRGTTWEIVQRGEERGQRPGQDWEFARRIPLHEVIRLRLWPDDFDKKASGPRFSYYEGFHYFAGTCVEIF